MRLTAFSVASEPSRSTTLAFGRPSRPLRATSTATRSPSSAPFTAAGAIDSSRPRLFLSIGTRRPPSPERAEHAEHAVLGPVEHLDGAAVIVGAVRRRSISRSAPALCRRRPVFRSGRARRGTWRRIFGGSPCSSRPIRRERRSARRRRRAPVMSARTTLGRAPAWWSFLRRFSMWPSSARSRSMRLERGAVCILEPEGTGDLTGADLAGFLADEGKHVFFAGKGVLMWS